MKKSIFLSVVFVVLFAFSMTASASEPIGEITISDDDGAAVAVWFYHGANHVYNATVVLSQNGNVIYSSSTGGSGRALFFGVTPGTYNIGCDDNIGMVGFLNNQKIEGSHSFDIYATIFY